MVEYLVILVLLMSTFAVAGLVTQAVQRQSARTKVLMGSDFP